jgi:hypothetical protein
MRACPSGSSEASGQCIAVVEVNRVLLGLKSLGRIANPPDADRNQAFFRAARARQR